MSHRIPTQTVPNAGGGSLVNNRVLSTKGCKLLTLSILNTANAQQYYQIHETAVLPADTTIPKMPSIPVAAGAFVQVDFGVNGIDLDALTVCNSSTAATKTIGAADSAIVATLLG